MEGDFLIKYDDDRILYKLNLDFKTYHQTIKGIDVFVYNRKQLEESHGWVCIDKMTGSCIDNKLMGHSTKKQAFKSATEKLNQYTNKMIIKTQQDRLKSFENSGIEVRKNQGLNQWML